MKKGSIVETVNCFKHLSQLYNLDYPSKGDVLTVSFISEHPDKECRSKGIVLLHFEELNNHLGICNK